MQNVASDVDTLRNEQKGLEDMVTLGFESLLHPQLGQLRSPLGQLRSEPCCATSVPAECTPPTEPLAARPEAKPSRMPELPFTSDAMTEDAAMEGASSESSDANSETTHTSGEENQRSLREHYGKILSSHEQDPRVAITLTRGAECWRKARRDVAGARALEALLHDVRGRRAAEEPLPANSPQEPSLPPRSAGAECWRKARRDVAGARALEALLHDVRGRRSTEEPPPTNSPQEPALPPRTAGGEGWRKARKDVACARALGALLHDVRCRRSVEEPPPISSPQEYELPPRTAGWGKVRRAVVARSALEALLHQIRGRQVEQFDLSDLNALISDEMTQSELTPRIDEDLSVMGQFAELTADLSVMGHLTELDPDYDQQSRRAVSMLAPVGRRRQRSKMSMSKIHAHLQNAHRERRLVMPWGGSGVGTCDLHRNTASSYAP